MFRAAFLLALVSVTSSQQRWSRQISTYAADHNDWVPLPGPVERSAQIQTPIKRQAVAEPRILAEPYTPFQRPTGFGDTFPSRNFFPQSQNRQLYLQSVPAVPSAPQNFITDQGFGQNVRFGVPQPPTFNQGFLQPQFNFEFPQPKRPQNIKFESFPKSLPVSPQAKPFGTPQVNKPRPVSTKLVDGYQADNLNTSFPFPPSKRKPISLQKMKFDRFEKPQVEQAPISKQKSEKEEVQLLYVPVDSLHRGQLNYRPSNYETFNSQTYQKLPLPQLPHQPAQQQFAADYQRPITRPIETYNFGKDVLNPYRHNDQVPKYSTNASPFPTPPPPPPVSSTQKPKKLKPHQPPLAVFLVQDGRKSEKIRVGDVLTSLKNAETIAVLDTVSPSNAPKVFIGPSTLNPPENYVKFELPYLSNIENSDKKLRQLPFFVAPLSYKTPDGFAKIPFPSPHVGSVIVNSQVKETPQYSTPEPDIIPNSYTASQYNQDKSVTQKPTFSYYSTGAPSTSSAPQEYQNNYYSFEPQTVQALRQKEQAAANQQPQRNNYYSNNNQKVTIPEVKQEVPVQKYTRPQYIEEQKIRNQPEQYKPVEQNYNTPEPIRYKSSTTPRPATTKQTTTKSTYPSQLLETHNPFSINQAFQYSTPLAYNPYDNENYSSPPNQPQLPSSTAIPEPVTEKEQKPSLYSQQYNPEIQYNSEKYQNTNYNAPNEYSTQPELTPVNIPQDNSNYENQYNVDTHTQSQQEENNSNKGVSDDFSYTLTKSPYDQPIRETEESQETSTASSTTSTTTRRTQTRGRGRPRYTTTPKTDVTEPSRTNTRKPLRERRPLPTRSRYEPNKITTEKPTRRPTNSAESTTKSSRSRTRGRVQFKPTESEDYVSKKEGNKEQDLAYQRDILHQNYPVTLMERMSTVDVEAMTEPTSRLSSTKNSEAPYQLYDTEQAYSNEQAFSQKASEPTRAPDNFYNRAPENVYTRAPETVYTRAPENVYTRAPENVYTRAPESEESLVSRKQPPQYEEYSFHPRSSKTHVETTPSYTETETEELPQRTTAIKSDVSTGTESVLSVSDKYVKDYHATNDDEETITTTRPELEITKISSVYTEESVDETYQTTPTNRLRLRPGSRNQNQITSTESPVTAKPKSEVRKRPSPQTVTYRPSFDRRRTTMRIDEIEADLKTKPIHSRTETQDRHPVYRPDPTTEPTLTTLAETSSKRGQFRRRRPSSTTEAPATKKPTYELKSRFKGRRPTTEKAEKVEAETETAPATTRKPLVGYKRLTRPRLSERYNKKPAVNDGENEDQDSNHSINRPKYILPDDKLDEQWSSKYNIGSFKPYNPNEIIEERRLATTERNSDDLDIITAKNDYDDLLVSVTPASNKPKQVPEIPPTLEALVEQSKGVQSEDSVSTFESMLEEVMKSLEEKDEDEFSGNVMKHKGGEIGEIPPESETAAQEIKSTTVEKESVTEQSESITPYEEEDVPERPKPRRRGFWKKVNVRPVTTESIEAAESQYYPSSVNHLGNQLKPSEQAKYNDKAKVTTYKPQRLFINSALSDNEVVESLLGFDIPKIKNDNETKQEKSGNEMSGFSGERTTETPQDEQTTLNPSEMDLGTGTPYTTLSDEFNMETTKSVDRSDGFNLMDYIFGNTNEDNGEDGIIAGNIHERSTEDDSEIRVGTTEAPFIPDEFTDETRENYEATTTNGINEFIAENFETTTKSSFMDPNKVMSTSMSTEISHETEICFRGKCIKTTNEVL